MANVSKTTLNMNRRFKVSAEKVCDAWLNPAMMRRWLFTREATNKVALSEPRVGGEWQITEHREGTDYTAIGEYIEIDRPNRLVFTFKMPQFSDSIDTITVEIRALEQGCEMSFTQEIFVPHQDNWTEADIEKALKEYRDGSEHGWSLMFGGLNDLLALQFRVEKIGARTLDDATIDGIYAEHVRDEGEQTLAALSYLGYVDPTKVASTALGRNLLRSFADPSNER
ncbi:SRPBCC family protein [Cohnella kolymensis]|uniref:SRPBCC family protein n=1 Tax=Cohnella kolymensis TaxID=1590652 RepID=UPI0009E2001C